MAHGSLLAFGLGAGTSSGFGLVRGLTYTAEAGLSGYAIYDGSIRTYEGIQEGDALKTSLGVGETLLGGLGLYGSGRALTGEIRLGLGGDALVIDDALLDAYLAESLAPVAQRNSLVLGNSRRAGTPLLHSEFSSNALAYLRVIELHTGFRLHQAQRFLLMDNLRRTSYSRLSSVAGRAHRRGFSKRVKDAQILLWEENTGRVWPRYSGDLFNSQGKLLRKNGDPYDAHHIIENVYGGPHEWWNLTPARFPDQHQGGIHTEEVLKILFQ